ncbi:MAG: radical SAM family heme chaperone HemW [Caldisericia bacterium]|nr:radical SAM family heme chaperone HemW [Caldisericia bacterium]
MTGLYVHIPFCVRKCDYCDFYSLAKSEGQIHDYVEAVLEEAKQYQGLHFGTIYLGGGTPSLLGSKNLEKLYLGLKKIFGFEKILEATIEANPESLTEEFALSARNYGFDRVSIGIQSLNDGELQSVGRIHNSKKAIDAIGIAVKYFKRASVDAIIGLPGQTKSSLLSTLSKFIELGLKHISAYCLSVEEGTKLYKNIPGNLPSDDEQATLFEQCRDFLVSKNFYHYEISNFATSGEESLHNINYWKCGEYLGLGPGASSHLDGIRFKNEENLDKYINNPISCKFIEEKLGPEDKIFEEAMLNLRLLETGTNLDLLSQKYKPENISRLQDRLDELAQNGKLDKNGNIYTINPSFVLVSNPVFSKILSG